MDEVEAQAVADTFTDGYYKLFEADRNGLQILYDETHSVLKYYDSPLIFGKDAIMKKLVEWPVGKVKHIISRKDGQPTADGGVLINVIGQIKIDEGPPNNFFEMFHLKKTQSSPSYIVMNQYMSGPVF